MPARHTARTADIPRFAVERQDTIVRRLRAEPSVAVAALARELGVSEDSIRRDLRALAQRGLVRKTHGGAVAAQVNAVPVRERVDLHGAAKQAIAAQAAALVGARQSLFIGPGSTALHFARRLAQDAERRPLTVVTPALDIAQALAESDGVRLVLAGGEWNPVTRAFEGPATLEQLRAHRADWAFLGACAVHPRAGITSADGADAANARAMLEGSLRGVLLVDASKWGSVEPHAVAPASRIDRVITDLADEAMRRMGFGAVDVVGPGEP